jgi:hypothetical protein
MTMFQRLLSITALLALGACGGGGGSSGTAPFGGGTTGGGSTTATNLVLTLSSTTIPNDGSQTVTVTVTAVNANNSIVASVPVTFAVDSGVITPLGTATDENGVVTATVGIGSNSNNRIIKITATSGSLTQSTNLQVISATAGAGLARMAVQLSGTTVTSTSPVTVTATLTDATGNPVGSRVVSFSTLRGNLATLSASTALTNSLGVATVTLSSAGSGVQGADEVVATGTVSGSTVQGSASFAVAAQTPTINFNPYNSSLTFTTAPLALSAVVRDAAGAVVPNLQVRFTAANGLVRFSAATALTDGSGTATVQVSPVSAASSGAEIITAAATVGTQAVQALATVRLTSQSPSLNASITNSTISATAPQTLTVQARDLTGAALAGAVVSFSSQTALATFTPAAQVTDSSGFASTVVSPRTAGTNGADTLIGSVTVQGLTATAQQVVQFVTSAPSGIPTLDLSMATSPATSPISISAASPATVTATLRDAQGKGVPSQVVTFSVIRALAVTNVATALTNTAGVATVVLSPANAAAAGADEISASVNYAGVALQRTQGFQVQATPVTLVSLVATANPLSPYGQTDLTLTLSGASVTSPVNISVSSSCVSQGKATLSPATFTATSNTVTMQYRDNGCGAVQTSDQLQAVVTSTGASRSLTLTIQPPTDSSIAFVTAAPEQIYLRGSGFTETSLVTFEVRDTAGNPLPNRVVQLGLQSGAGGVTMEGVGVGSSVQLTSNAQGRVAVRVNSGTLPTPVRVSAKLVANPAIATVSSNLSVAVGLPSQLNFSMSQGTRNIEGYNIDGTPNTYQIIAADRSGNPVPAGTSINFVTEGGQIEAIKQTQLVNGIARTTANFVSSEPRPIDGRVTITAYALGEESFLDLNGNNAYDPPGTPGLPGGEPFQDLGRIFKDRNFDGLYDPTVDEYIPLNINDSGACVASPNILLNLDTSIPSVPGTCNGAWSGAGQVYVRRAVETVLSTSGARPLWPIPTDGRLLGAGLSLRLQVSPDPAPASTVVYRAVLGDTLCSAGASGTFTVLVADANPGKPKSPFINPLTDYDLFPRYNPMAAGTTVNASTPTTGFGASTVSGSPVPSTTTVSAASIGYNFTDATVNEGIVSIAFTSPVSGTSTSTSVRVVRGAAATAAGCP